MVQCMCDNEAVVSVSHMAHMLRAAFFPWRQGLNWELWQLMYQGLHGQMCCHVITLCHWLFRHVQSQYKCQQQW